MSTVILTGGIPADDWSARPSAIQPLPPSAADREAFSKRLGFDLPFTEFIASGKWDVDDVLRPIYEEASKVEGREFPYPEN